MIIATSNNEKYTIELFNGKEMVYADVSKDKGGKGNYFRPHELLASSYASCLNISVRMLMDSMKIAYNEIIVKVELDRSNENKTVFNYSVEIDSEIDDTSKKEIMSKIKDCPVRKTLSKQIEFIEKRN